MKRSHKTSTRLKPPSRKATAHRRNSRWSAEITKHSDALDLQHDVFKSKDPRKIARSLKHSAKESNRRKGTPYQSAMSMLNFYINRAGKHLPTKQKQVLEKASRNCATCLDDRDLQDRQGWRAAPIGRRSADFLTSSLIPVLAEQIACFFHSCLPNPHHFVVVSLVQPTVVSILKMFSH